jgi:hypothetical protein
VGLNAAGSDAAAVTAAVRAQAGVIGPSVTVTVKHLGLPVKNDSEKLKI